MILNFKHINEFCDEVKQFFLEFGRRKRRKHLQWTKMFCFLPKRVGPHKWRWLEIIETRLVFNAHYSAVFPEEKLRELYINGDMDFQEVLLFTNTQYRDNKRRRGK